MYAYRHLDRQQHGTLEFPVEYYFVDSQHPRYQMPFHWHSEWELLRVLRGTLQIALDDEQYTLQCGDVLLMRGGSLHGCEPIDCVYEGLVFDLYGIFRKMDMVKPYLRPFYSQACLPQCCYRADADSGFLAVADELLRAFHDCNEVSCPELETVAGISRLFAWIWKHGCYRPQPDQTQMPKQRIDRIKSVLEHIESHYSGSITLEDLAGIAGMNPKYFCRVFRSLTHHSPVDYLNYFRIEQAAYLLDSTDLSVTEVGAQCGFWESSYFTKVFKKYKGITPNRYRNAVGQ